MLAMKKIMIAVLAMTAGSAAMAGPILWVDDANGRLGKVDVATGGVTVVGQMRDAMERLIVMTDIAFDPSGKLWGITFGELYTINTTNADVTLVGNLGTSLNSLVFGSDGTLYAANNSLYKVNTTTGAASLVGGGGGYNSAGDLAFVGGNLYLSSVYAASDALFQLNTTTGLGTLVGSLGYGGVYGLATDNNVDLYGLAGTRVLSVNTTTGAGTTLVDYNGKGLSDAWGSAFFTESSNPPTTSVPEPASLAIMGLGLLGLSLARRRKRA